MIIDKYNKETYNVINIHSEFSLHLEAFILLVVFLKVF